MLNVGDKVYFKNHPEIVGEVLAYFDIDSSEVAEVLVEIEVADNSFEGYVLEHELQLIEE